MKTTPVVPLKAPRRAVKGAKPGNAEQRVPTRQRFQPTDYPMPLGLMPTELGHQEFAGGQVSDTIISTLERIKNGIPLAEFEEMARKLGLTQEVFARKIGVSMPTLSRRRSSGRPLDPEASDHLIRFQRLFRKAVDLFDGNEENAREWLGCKESALGYLKPIDVAETEAGAREVENVIGRLEHGVYT